MNIQSCPFCGGEAKLIVIDHTLGGPSFSFVACETCGAKGGVPLSSRYPTSEQPDRQKAEEKHDLEAIKLWNKRERGPMINYDRDIKGFFHTMSRDEREKIMDIVATFHIRDGVKHDDGSMGTMKITNKQMNDCLAYVLRGEDMATKLNANIMTSGEIYMIDFILKNKFEKAHLVFADDSQDYTTIPAIQELLKSIISRHKISFKDRNSKQIHGGDKSLMPLTIEMYRCDFEAGYHTSIEMPEKAEILYVEEDRERVCIYALVHKDAPKAVRTFAVVGPGDNFRYETWECRFYGKLNSNLCFFEILV